MAQSYSFPVLSERELLSCLADMDMPMSAASLAKPSAEAVRPIYEGVLTALTGITRDDLQQPVFAAIDVLEFPELHDESIPFRALLKRLTELMNTCGVKGFGMQDVCMPDPVRLRRNLSAVINFAKFREEKLGPYAEMQDQLDADMQDASQLEAQTEDRVAELERLKAERSAQEPGVAAGEAEVQELYKENQNLNRQQAGLNAEVRTLKENVNVLSDKLRADKLKVEESRQEAQRLRKLVVESPEKLQARLEEVAESLEHERSACAEAERRLRELQGRLDAIGKVEREVAKATAMLAETEAELQAKKAASRRAKALRGQLTAAERGTAEAAARQQHLLHVAASLRDRALRQDSHAELAVEAAASAVDEAAREKEAVEAETAVKLAKLAENEAVARSLSKRIRDVEGSYESQAARVLGRFAELHAQVREYHGSMEAAMAAPSAEAALVAIRQR